jgi:leader peptidase (prepilin peptidase) / N-methyltransferase
MFPAWTWVVGFGLGAVFGSFLNVVIYRLPRGIPLGKPSKSFCPACKHPLGIPDLVPLLSWLFLRGKCRHCGQKVSSRYFWVEVFNGAIWAGIWYQYLIAGSDPARGIAYAAAATTLVAIIFIDWELYIIPDQINAFLWVVGIGLNIWLLSQGRAEAWTWGIPSALAGWITGVGVLWGIAFLGRVLFGKDAMGHGDIKMARGIGAVLFPTVAVLGFALAVALGAILGVLQILARRGAPAGSEEERVFDVAVGLPNEILAQIDRYRAADAATVGAEGKALAETIRKHFNTVPDKLKGGMKEFLEVLESGAKVWVATPADQNDYRISDRLYSDHAETFDKLEKALSARQWRDAEAAVGKLHKAATAPADRAAMEEVAKAVAARRRFGLIPRESIGSLLKCGLGYLLCVDIVGLFFPKLYESYFGEPAFEPLEDLEEYPIERTMIPFGPYLALGAIVATVFQSELLGWVDAYMNWAAPSEQSLEQTEPPGGQ